MGGFRYDNGQWLVITRKVSMKMQSVDTQFSPAIPFTIDPNSAIQLNIPAMVFRIYATNIRCSRDTKFVEVGLTHLVEVVYPKFTRHNGGQVFRSSNLIITKFITCLPCPSGIIISHAIQIGNSKVGFNKTLFQDCSFIVTELVLGIPIDVLWVGFQVFKSSCGIIFGIGLGEIATNDIIEGIVGRVDAILPVSTEITSQNYMIEK